MLSIRSIPAASHRLDLRASGLVAIAKHGSALRKLNDAFRHRHVSRGYLALVRTWRAVSAQTIEEPLATSRGHVQVDPAGAPAVTIVKPLGFDPDNGVALVALRLQSGRQHQARVHLASAIGAIVGDRRYGDLLNDASRIALHAGWISWDASIGLSAVTFQSEPAADFWSLCPRTLAIPANWSSEIGLQDDAKTLES